MRLPGQSPAIARTRNTDPTSGGVEPSGCNVFKKIACAGALAACAQCLAGIGAAGCIDCI